MREREALYLLSKIDARYCTHCCSGKLVLYILSICVYSLRFPALKELEPYFHLWPVRLCSTIPHYLTNGAIF